MSHVIAPTFDQQGNKIMPQTQSHKPLGLKKSPSVVFSWPAFANNTRAEDVMVPIKSLVQVRSTDTIRSVLWTLIKNKLECVPVFNDATRKYVGFVDMFDLVLYIANASGSGVTRSDFFQLFKRQQFADNPISKITSAASKDNCNSVSEFSPISSIFELTVSANRPIVPVMNKQKVVSLVSQGRLAECLFENIPNFKQLASKKISQLYLSGTDNVYTVEENTPLVSAFVYMEEKGVKGLAVVNKDGQFVDAVNSFDVKGLVHGDFFSDLRQPVLRYLGKSRILLNENLAPVVCTQEETLSDLLQKMAKENVYRVFVVDAERKPISVISLRDILKALHSFVPEEELRNSSSSVVGSGGQ